MAKLHFRSANYLLRPLTAADISDDWAAWLANPTVAMLLNAPRRKLSRRELQEYLQRFDNKSRVLLGFFHEPSGRHIGILTIMESTDGQHALLNILIGVSGFSAISSLRTAFYDYLFRDKGYRSAVASVVATNAPMIRYLKRAGWESVSRSKTRSASGEGEVELLTFRLTRERYIGRYRGTPA